MNRLYICVCRINPRGIFNTEIDSFDQIDINNKTKKINVYKYGDNIYAASTIDARFRKDYITNLLSCALKNYKLHFDEICFIIHRADIGFPLLDQSEEFLKDERYKNFFLASNPSIEEILNNRQHLVFKFSHNLGEIKSVLGQSGASLDTPSEINSKFDNFINRFKDTTSQDSNDNLTDILLDFQKKKISDNISFFVVDLHSYNLDDIYKTIVDKIALFQLCGFNKELYNTFMGRNCNVEIYYDIDTSLIPFFNKDNFEYAEPIIIYGNKPLEDLKNTPEIDRRISYLDSSIWIRYVYDEESFAATKQDIKRNYDQGLYKSSNAIECLEFHARLIRNSFLRAFGNEGNHSSVLSPFLFHSESAMKKESDDLWTKYFKVKHERLKWRVLLIDDHSTKKNIPNYVKDKNNFFIISKCEIIRNALKDYFSFSGNSQELCANNCQASLLDCYKSVYAEGSDNHSKKAELIIDCCDNIEDALIKLNERRYDIIFLDYLLGWGEKQTERKYSYELLSKIKKGQEKGDPSINKTKGPFNQFWFFFISAFPNAVLERLSEQGMQFNTDYWHLARGACPTTTPELFKFNLLSFMKRQIEVMSKLPNVKPLTNPDEILVLIYEDNNKKPISSRASDYFDSLLKMRANYHILEKDYTYNNSKELGSPLVHSLFPETMSYNTAFWEHLMNLVYLTAFGTIRQWHEMWQEYQLVKSKLNPKTTDLIEEYIVAFKNGTYI